jgi:hypothetical protein
MFVCLLGFSMYINMEPLLGGTFPASLELGIQKLILAMAVQRQPNAGEDLLIISGKRIKILEQAGIRSNPEPTIAQHAKAVERSDGIRVQVD